MAVTKATKDYIEKHYTLWRNKQPRGQDTVTLYADYLGVTRNTLNNWLTRGTTPSRDHAPVIAVKCDFETLGISKSVAFVVNLFYTGGMPPTCGSFTLLQYTAPGVRSGVFVCQGNP